MRSREEIITGRRKRGRIVRRKRLNKTKRRGGEKEETQRKVQPYSISSKPSVLEYINTYIIIFMPHYQSYTFTTAPGPGMNVSPGKTKIKIKHGYAVNVNI